MQLWTDFITWLNSTNGHYLISNAILPFLAIIVAGVIAALIGRSSAKRVIALSDREVKASAVTALISAARKAAVWNTLPAPEQQHVDHLIGDADIRLRLLPVAGTGLAADWARHEIADMKRNAVSFSFQAEQTLIVFRDRLIDWQARPTRAKKLFKNDLDSWAYDSSLSEQELVHQQQEWAASQVDKTGSIDVTPATPTATVSAPVAAPAAPAAPASTPVPVAAPAAAPAPASTPAPDFAPFSVTSPAEAESETPVFSRFTSRFARPAAETSDNDASVATHQSETVELVEPSVPLHPVDRRDEFEDTPSFIEPDREVTVDRNDNSAELPEIVIPASDDSSSNSASESSHNQPSGDGARHN